MHQSLCKQWKPDIEEEEIIKIILENTNPQMASQLISSSVVKVDRLVRLVKLNIILIIVLFIINNFTTHCFPSYTHCVLQAC